MVSDGQQTDETDEHESRHDRGGNACAQANHHPIEQATGDAGRGVYLLMEDDGYVVEQHIAHYAARSSRQTAHDDGHPVGMPVSYTHLTLPTN